MPQAALDLAGADHCVPLEAIPALLNRLCLA
jgi:two-component system chemotaxis response regulator CheB